MKPFIESGDEAGLYSWLLGKDESQMNAFIEAFPILSEFLHSIIEGKGAVDENAESWAEFGNNISSATNAMERYYTTQQKALSSQIGEDRGREILGEGYQKLSEDGPQAYYDWVESLSEAEREWLTDASEGHKEMIKLWGEEEIGIEDTEKALKSYSKEMSDFDLEKMVENGEVLQEFPDWFEACAKGGIEFHEAMAEATTRMETLSKAQGYLNGLQNGTIKETEHVAEAIEFLSSTTGYSAGILNNDLSPAMAWLASQSTTTGNMINFFKNQLQAAGAVNFSTANWRAELNALATDTGNAYNGMAQLLQVLLATNSALNGTTQVEIPKFSGGGRGGGGSSGGSAKEISEIEKMLDLMEDIQKIRKHQREMISTTRDYYENEGYFTTAIKYYEDERAAVEENNKVLEENLRKIEALLPAKQREVAAMDTSDKEYEQAAKDLEALQEAHQEYSLELLENKNTIAEFNRAIKDMQDEIRDMEIELRETILEAIEDREELNERMLQGTIDVENEILDVIKARYEKERDLAIETAEAKIEALEAESDALDEQLRKRKEMAEAEDKQLKLAQLQAQLARISADPTRRKEELELRKQIQELRDEMAWDLAEKEVDAQKESIDQQITSLEDYIEQVEQYYEDLFKHPQKLFEEMKTIMAKTDDEILEWLKQNNEEYANSTEATQKDMINSWNEMLMDMHGNIKTYWDEVEQIIAGGDEAIINFLKEHSADYKEAGKLQAEAYVDEWKKQLDDLARAYEDYYTRVKETEYKPVGPSTGSGNSGGSGGNGGNNSSTTPTKKPTTVYYLTINGKIVGNPVLSESDMAKIVKATRDSGSYQSTDNISYTSKIIAYAKGGLANFTGPAWLDGTPSAPERILSPYQTKLFEDMISSLHQIKVSAPSIPSGIFDGGTNNSQAITFGDIILNVDQLADDSDYGDVVDRLMEEIMERMTRGMPVGGIRIPR